MESHSAARIKTAGIGRAFGDRVFDAVTFFLLTVAFFIVAYPLYFVIISSISSPDAVAGGKVVLWPVGISFDGYIAVFKDESVIGGFLNSVFYTVLGTSINLFVTLPTAYALSRDDFRGRRGIMVFYMFTMFFSGGLIPTYIVVRSVGFIDTPWALVVPGALGVYNMIVARTFFKSTLPAELLEAAKLDGCGNTRFFLNIALPLSSAIIAILVLYYGIGHWNAYFSALLYITDAKRFPLQLVLRSILIQNSMALSNQFATTADQRVEAERLRQVAELMKYSLIIVSSLPVIVLYPFIQKYFVKGVMIGSIKG